MRRTTHFYVLVASTLLLLQGMRSEYAICNQKREILPESETDDRNIDYKLRDIKRHNLSIATVPTPYRHVQSNIPSASISQTRTTRYRIPNGDFNRNVVSTIQATAFRRVAQNDRSSRDLYFRNKQIYGTTKMTANCNKRLLDSGRRHRQREGVVASNLNRVTLGRTVRNQYEDIRGRDRNEQNTRAVTDVRYCDVVRNCMRIDNARSMRRDAGTWTSDRRSNNLRAQATKDTTNEQQRSRNGVSVAGRRLEQDYDRSNRRNTANNRRFTLTRRISSFDERRTQLSDNLQRSRQIRMKYRRQSLTERSPKSSKMQRQYIPQFDSETIRRQRQIERSNALIGERRVDTNARSYDSRREHVDLHQHHRLVSTTRSQMKRVINTGLKTRDTTRTRTIRSNDQQDIVQVRYDERLFERTRGRMVGSTLRDRRSNQDAQTSRRVAYATREGRERTRERRDVSSERHTTRLDARDRGSTSAIRSRVIVSKTRFESRQRSVSDLRNREQSRRQETREPVRLQRTRRDINERERDLQRRSSRQNAQRMEASVQDRVDTRDTRRDITSAVSTRMTAIRRQTPTHQGDNASDDKITEVRENRSRNRQRVSTIRFQKTMNEKDLTIRQEPVRKLDRYQTRQERRAYSEIRRGVQPLRTESFGKQRDISAQHYKVIPDRRTHTALYQTATFTEHNIRHGQKSDVPYKTTSSLSSGFYTMIQSIDHTSIARTLVVGFVGVMGRSIWQKQC